MKILSQLANSPINQGYVKSTQIFFFGYFTFCCLLAVLPDVAFAGTGGEELQTVYQKIVDIAQGYGGKSIAGLGFLSGLYFSLVKHSLSAAIPSFGIGVLAGLGPNIVTSGVSALI